MDHNQEEIELIICLVLTFEITFLKHTQFTIWFQHKEIKWFIYTKVHLKDLQVFMSLNNNHKFNEVLNTETMRKK